MQNIASLSIALVLFNFGFARSGAETKEEKQKASDDLLGVSGNRSQALELSVFIPHNTISDPGCESTKVLALDEPIVYLTVSARASVSLLGSVEALHVVMNWQRPKKEDASPSEGDGDWIGLFDSAVGVGDTLNGE